MAKKVSKAAAAKAAPVNVQDRWSAAVEAEAKAFGNAQSGDQMQRLEAFRALKELDAAHAACESACSAEEGAAEAPKQ